MTRTGWFFSLFAATLVGIPAHAETFTFDVDACTGGCLNQATGPSIAPTVTLTQGWGTTAGTFTLINPGGGALPTVEATVNLPPPNDVDGPGIPFDEFAATGAGFSLGFNLNSEVGSSVSVDLSDPVDFSGSTENFIYSMVTGNAASVPGKGDYDYQIACVDLKNPPPGCHGGNVGDADQLTFVVSSANGVQLSDFIANSSGYYFLSDIAVFDGTSSNALATGDILADGAGGTIQGGQTPEPATMLLSLFGLGLIGVRVARRKQAI